MRSRLLIALGLLVASRVAAAQDVLVFVDVNVVTMTDAGVLERQSVVIRDGLIQTIGPSETVVAPAGAEVVQGEGRYLTPGLIDFHVHLRSTSELISYLRHGVTTVVQLSGGSSGAPDVLAYKRQIEAGDLLGPMLYASGPILDGDPPIFPGVSVSVTTAAQAAEIVRRQAAQGYDLIKVYNRLPKEALRPLVDEAHRLGLIVVGHIPRPEDRASAMEAALESGLDVIAHAEEFFFSEFYQGVDSLLDLGTVPWRSDATIGSVAEQVRDAGVAVVPNLSFVAATRTQLDSIDALWSDPEFSFLEPAVQRFWRNGGFAGRSDIDRFSRRERAKERFLDQLTLSFSRAGVPLMLGTDASFVGLFPGASAHLDLRQLVEAGLSPAEAYAAGTSVPGRFLLERGVTSHPVGVIEPGARADLILIAGNPLVDVNVARDPVGVIAQGRWLPRAELIRRRSEGR